jgi:hypothetical protein
LKRVVGAWKELKCRHSEERRNRVFIRKALKRRPELARPLFVVRNILLFKAFQRFKIGVSESIR